jgi:ADP-ribose pyrophosphatase YjhB (NUDIX family)
VTDDIAMLLDEVRALAETGLHYSTNPFERARCERLVELAAQEYHDRTGLDTAEVRARFDAEVGYQTAKVGADAAIFNTDDRILLVRRVDDDKWGLISGFVEPTESPEQTIVRELEEEIGLRGRVDRLVGVYFRPAEFGVRPHGIVSVVYLCSIVGGAVRPQEHEVQEVAWRDIDDLAPGDWHHHHELLARAAREARWRTY